MGVSIVFGGQFGSEGKGKVAHWFAKEHNASSVVKVGGTNSGHTVVGGDGKEYKFRVLPTVAIEKNINCVLPSGSYIDLDILKQELLISGLPDNKLKISPNAVIITEEMKEYEKSEGIIDSIGSTGSGTGAATIDRIRRKNGLQLAKNEPELKKYLTDTIQFLRGEIENNLEVVIEGTQGFGLSLLHSEHYPFVTARDTSAAAFLSEAGLSPMDVTNIIMVIRAYPIRVSGHSGSLPNETTWENVTLQAGSRELIQEYTTVSQKLRRVAVFDPSVVRQSITSNKPNIVVLNHCDYFDISSKNAVIYTQKVSDGISEIEEQIGRIDYIGLGKQTIISKQ